MQLDPNMAGLACRFTPGQRVVCIFGGPWFDVGSSSTDAYAGPEKDAIYLVLDVIEFENEVYLQLDGMPSQDVHHHVNFRPLRETSIEVFEKLLCGTPTSEPITRRVRETTP